MNSWLSPIYSLLFLALWRISYQAANGIGQANQLEEQMATETPLPQNPPASQRGWAEKAVRKYAESQEKKWRNWQDAMFEAE